MTKRALKKRRTLQARKAPISFTALIPETLVFVIFTDFPVEIIKNWNFFHSKINRRVVSILKRAAFFMGMPLVSERLRKEGRHDEQID